MRTQKGPGKACGRQAGMRVKTREQRQLISTCLFDTSSNKHCRCTRLCQGPGEKTATESRAPLPLHPHILSPSLSHTHTHTHTQTQTHEHTHTHEQHTSRVTHTHTHPHTHNHTHIHSDSSHTHTHLAGVIVTEPALQMGCVEARHQAA